MSHIFIYIVTVTLYVFWRGKKPQTTTQPNNILTFSSYNLLIFLGEFYLIIFSLKLKERIEMFSSI